jgi:pSer/pThr/pTyr-binding forkhead associated (FHA) protein
VSHGRKERLRSYAARDFGFRIGLEEKQSLVQVNLEIQSGRLTGKRLVIKEGETVTVGRTENSDFAIPEDTFLSRVHFAVECSGTVCRVIDRKSANGTFVNGSKIAEVFVQDGDEIVAGKTRFRVSVVNASSIQPSVAQAETPHASPPAPPSSRARQDQIHEEHSPMELQTPVKSDPEPEIVTGGSGAGFESTTALIGSWFFGIIPPGWSVVEGVGLRRLERGAFLSEVTVSDEMLTPGQTFSQYVESQIEMIRLLISKPEILPTEPLSISGTEETKVFLVRYRTDDGRHFIQRQIYVRQDQKAGSLTWTITENDLPRVQPYFEQILHGVTFTAQP